MLPEINDKRDNMLFEMELEYWEIKKAILRQNLTNLFQSEPIRLSKNLKDVLKNKYGKFELETLIKTGKVKLDSEFKVID